MIKIIDDWYVVVETNPTNYIVRKGKGQKGKNGKWLDKPRGYFGSLSQAVKFIREKLSHMPMKMARERLGKPWALSLRPIRGLRKSFKR